MRRYAVITAVILIIFVVLGMLSDHREKEEKVPQAKKVAHVQMVHGQELMDDYHWLRDPKWPDVQNPEVLNYLKAENEYFAAKTASSARLQEQLFEELKGRIKEEDYTVPVKKGDFYYYSYIKPQADYWISARKRGSLDAAEEVLLDQNVLAAGAPYFSLQSMSISSDHNLLAYSVDLKGDERYTIYIKDLSSGEILEDIIPNTVGSIVWHESRVGFFYIPADENWRPKEVWFHILGGEDHLIYKEEDETFRVSISKSASKEYIMLHASSSEENELYLMSAKELELKPKLFRKRQSKVLFDLTHHGNYFYMLINDAGKNFRLMRALVENHESDSWQEIIPHSKTKYLNSLSAYKNFMILESRIQGLVQIEVLGNNGDIIDAIKFDDQTYDAGSIYTDFEYDSIRYAYSSLRTPASIFEYDYRQHHTTLLKEQEIPSGFDKNDYVVKRIWSESRDGVKVPISLIYHKDKVRLDGSAPLYLYGYGSYGHAVPTNFRTTIFSLVDRGYIYAIAHIRGGDDLGFEWYEQAKFLHKKLTFYDFIDAADYLVKNKYTSTGNIVIAGGSAGGMLVGYAINTRPELYKAAILHVPFVDVLNTMLDDSLPLTPGEFKEWGNPKDAEYFEYIKSYSPYDNIRAQAYPHLFVTAGLSDPRVTYWEPAKFVAKLRELKTDDNLLLLKTNMEAGHAGKSGRYDILREIAEEYAIILKTFEEYN